MMSTARSITLAILAVSATTRFDRGIPAQPVDEILTRAEVYVSSFVTRFSTVVAEERYLQTSVNRNRLRGDIVRRRLVSDFLLVQIPGDARWRAFRDIREVDGSRVSGREARLTKLFLKPWTMVSEQIEEIDRDWTRYTLGDQARTINNPLLAVSFLQHVYRERFRFFSHDFDQKVGLDTRVVEFLEAARPTILRTVPDGDLPSDGRFWIESTTGRVVKSELKVSGADTVVTSFRFDTRLQMDIPFEMRENYHYRDEQVDGIATYVNLRRFQVHTDVRPK